MTRSTEPRDAQIDQDRAMQAADDHGVEMFARVFGIGLSAVLVGSLAWAAWTLLGGGL